MAKIKNPYKGYLDDVVPVIEKKIEPEVKKIEIKAIIEEKKDEPKIEEDKPREVTRPKAKAKGRITKKKSK